MKLKNKKTGEIVDFRYLQSDYVAPLVLTTYKNDKPEMCSYNSLAELNEEWEDAPEEPIEPYWFINDLDGEPMKCDLKNCGKSNFIEWRKHREEIGNCFSSKGEAELVVRKLKAWKRLKDNGFRFDHIRSIDGVSIKYKDLDQYTIIAYADEDGCDQEHLDLLFSGDEE